jgi:hypothetical protein
MIRKSNVLRLNRETVRELDRTELEKAAGGQTGITTNSCIPYSENAICHVPTAQPGCFQ